MLFGDKLRMLADERGITQVEMARMCGVTRSNLSKMWTNRTTDPRLATLVAIANGLGMTVSELVEGVEVDA